MLTCYDATTARWLWRAGLRCMLVGDTAAQIVFGFDSTLPVKLAPMIELTAAVRRGAPDALVMADMPFGSYQASADDAVANAVAFLADGGADCVKLEVDRTFGRLVERLSHAGVPVVAHIGSRPQTVRQVGGYRSVGKTPREADELADTAALMADRGAAMLLVEAVPAEVGARVVEAAVDPRTGEPLPVIGCGAGPACHGHVVVLHDLLGLTDWQPPFVTFKADLGGPMTDAVRGWIDEVSSGRYLAGSDPYAARPAAR